MLQEAPALGLGISDLVAAEATDRYRLVTLAEWVATIEPSFTVRTAATYRPYWRLAVAHGGDAALASLTVADLQVIVADAIGRAIARRPGSTGRASNESCVAALRALSARAVAAGVVPANPAAALVKPRRGRSRHRALADHEVADLIDAVRLTSRDPDLLLVRFHLETFDRAFAWLTAQPEATPTELRSSARRREPNRAPHRPSASGGSCRRCDRRDPDLHGFGAAVAATLPDVSLHPLRPVRRAGPS